MVVSLALGLTTEPLLAQRPVMEAAVVSMVVAVASTAEAVVASTAVEADSTVALPTAAVIVVQLDSTV